MTPEAAPRSRAAGDLVDALMDAWAEDATYAFTKSQMQNIIEWVRRGEAEAAAGTALDEVAAIVRRHTHQGMWAMTRFAGDNPEEDCLLCRALVAAGVLTLDEIGAGTRARLAGEEK